MSRAFVKEPDGIEAFEDLPDKLVSEHRNYVTAKGLALIEAEVDRLSESLAAAKAVNDRGDIARLSRDLRYWASRRATAELVERPEDTSRVQFGSTVTIDRDDGRQQIFQIVGEDESDPAGGKLSYVAPLAQALMGQTVGYVARAGSHDVEIVEIA